MDQTDQPPKLIFSHLTRHTQKALDLLARQDWIQKDWYLAGGTALALQFDHRVSVDLDFFTHRKDFNSDFIIRTLGSSDFKASITEKGTLYGELKNTKISFIAYPYFVPKQPFISYGKINILDARDIAVMKIIAISQRGKKRDFFDLYWHINNKESLPTVLKRIEDQFPNLAHNYHHILKSLTYFDEAEEDPDPQVFFDATWEEVKQYFLEKVPEIADQILK